MSKNMSIGHCASCKAEKKELSGVFLKQRNKHNKAYAEFLKKWLPKVWSGRLKGLSLLHGFR